jgi:hypothetical protein
MSTLNMNDICMTYLQDGSGRWMPLTEKAKALTEAALEPFGDDGETASTAYVREHVLEFDANAGKVSGDGVVALDLMGR